MKQLEYEFSLQKRKDCYTYEIKIKGSDMSAIATNVKNINEWAKSEFIEEIKKPKEKVEEKNE